MLVLDPKVFKAYDVRGIYPSELDEEGAYAIGRAFVEVFEPKRIAVGHDMRVSSPSMTEAVIRGASEGGADVLELGLVGYRDGLFRGRRARPRRRDCGHRLAQPEGLHGPEDRPQWGAPGRRRVGAAGDPRPRAGPLGSARATGQGRAATTSGSSSSNAFSRSSTRRRSSRSRSWRTRRTGWPV